MANLQLYKNKLPKSFFARKVNIFQDGSIKNVQSVKLQEDRYNIKLLATAGMM